MYDVRHELLCVLSREITLKIYAGRVIIDETSFFKDAYTLVDAKEMSWTYFNSALYE